MLSFCFPVALFAATGLTLSPGNVPFSQQGIDSESAARTVSLENNSSFWISISAIAIAPASSPFVISAKTCGTGIAAGASCTISVRYAPTVIGSQTAALTITDSASGSPQTVGLTGTGTTQFRISTTGLSFGNQAVGTTSGSESVSIANETSAAVSISSISIGGTNPGNFSVSGKTCGASLNGHSSCTISFSFKPTSASGFAATVSIRDGASNSPQTVSLTGTGTGGTTTAPAISINATSVAFGNVALNSAATQSVVLSSTGTAAVTVSAATVNGKGFTETGPTLPATLNPGQSATLSLQFDPTVAGAVNGQLTVTSNSSTNGTAVISLSGTGVPLEVELTWNAASSSGDSVAGYDVYRSTGGSTAYQLLNSSVDTETSYVDGAVQAGATYDYIVKSVDASGVESASSNLASVTIP